MCSSSSTPTFYPLHIPRTNRHFLKLSYPFPLLTHDPNFRPTSSRTRKFTSLSASVTQNNLQLSWASSDQQDVEDYNGWAIVEESFIPKKQKKGLPTFVLFGIGTSVVALLAVYAYFTLSRKGFVWRISSRVHVSVDEKSLGSEDGLKVDEVSDESLMKSADEEVDTIAKEVNGRGKWEGGKPGRVVVPVSADATQQEALLWLKNLKIIEDEVKADELCTRREYARWLILVNSRLERNQRNRLLPSVALAGSTINAFDDISAEDPDFEYIQALAEAGVVLSKLSGENLTSDLDSSKSSGGVNFFPKRLISREDLIGWRAKLEYQVMPGLNEEILRNKIGFLDARELKSDVLAVLFMDTLTNEKSIMRKVFGQIKRFQPSKPCTKAQAAVALTSGRITESIRHEFSKIEAENSSREIAMKEIKSAILERGETQRYWEKKLADERRRFLEVEAGYLEVLKDLENYKMNQDNIASNYLTEIAALDCQKQLVCSLKEEVDEMNQRIAYERAGYVDERHKIRSTVRELEAKYEKVLDSKSILEAELEVLPFVYSGSQSDDLHAFVLHSPNGTKLWCSIVPEELKPLINSQFDTLHQVFDFYENYAYQAGFSVRKGQSKTRNEIVTHQYLRCNKYGKPTQCKRVFDTMCESSLNVRQSTFTTCDCKAFLSVKYSPEISKYIVYAWGEYHNHPLVAPFNRDLTKKARRLSFSDKQFIHKMSLNRIGPVVSHRCLVALKGGHHHVHGTPVDFKNYSTSIRMFICEKDSQLVLDRMRDRSEIIPEFYYDFIVQNGQLRALFWVDEISKIL